MRKLSRHEKDMHIMGVMRPISEGGTRKKGKRKMIQIVLNKFMTLGKTPRALKRHFEENGLVPRQHDFILGYSNDFGLPQPAAPRGTERTLCAACIRQSLDSFMELSDHLEL
ncbi:hypothetical protein KUTeg_006065 [Tegillarca granosa]|uniref:Uncharacterized protein n=1 Tax=Tegillarca granosa TaxID=220873 RepID=A0ABQ9FHB1_TEGGR|nr:hypothetical protein KUTeg_006065 [Tegillarca granosa]